MRIGTGTGIGIGNCYVCASYIYLLTVYLMSCFCALSLHISNIYLVMSALLEGDEPVHEAGGVPAVWESLPGLGKTPELEDGSRDQRWLTFNQCYNSSSP